MKFNDVNWEETIPALSTSRGKTGIVRFSIARNKNSGSLSGVLYLSKDVAKKSGLQENGNAKVFTNPQNRRQVLIRPHEGDGGYRVSKLGTAKRPSNLVRLNFRLLVDEESLNKMDFKSSAVKYEIDEENQCIMIDTNWRK